MHINNEFEIGQIVFIITDEDQKERMVTGIQVRQNAILYIVQQLTTESYHYGIELTNTIDVLKKLNNG